MFVISRRLLLKTPALIGAPLLLDGCGGKEPPPPPVLDLTIIGGANQNPDSSGKPVSVALRLYELTGTAKFERADAFALIERGPATLGADSSVSEEFIIAPGETRPLTHALLPNAQFVGVIAVFRDIDRAVWRATAPVARNGVTKLVVRIDALKVTLTPA
jgi:type VI secretion system protein VasD